jgi:hypothetical protein
MLDARSLMLDGQCPGIRIVRTSLNSTALKPATTNYQGVEKRVIATSHALIVMSRRERDHFSSWEIIAEKVLGFNPQTTAICGLKPAGSWGHHCPRHKCRGNA